MAITAPQFNPVAIAIGPINIYWYAIAYIMGFILAYILFVPVAQKQKIGQNRSKDDLKKIVEDLLLFIVLGVVIGGRLGFILFYETAIIYTNPIQIFKVWQGGMSFHGGLIGVIIACLIYSRMYKKPYLQIMDVLAVLAPIGLFLGRIANFVNGELWGRATAVPWGMIFPYAQDGVVRHPSQLYEAALEGVSLFILMLICARLPWFQKASGRLSALFLGGYGLARFSVEYFREPNIGLGNVFLGLTMGQTLTLLMFVTSVILIFYSYRSKDVT